ncbi:Tfx family DNA-binding protein [Salarchaeum sp. JOR-1]|uniref:Tfx family DNA-binding protein n=1 Tax=Salarchaeum sp. JOR-1 TaxID=2599399 RepID=UPI00119891BA|nr:Tfx family DNA-binding protein [Salarchaeum sp. JOR-1]
MIDADDLLARTGFDASENVLTRRQAEVLALRERGVAQADIAASLGTSRANISNVEAAARENVAKARETVAFADALEAPVQVEVEEGTDLYDVPETVFDACDDAGVKVAYSAVDMMTRVSEAAGDAISGREVRTPVIVSVTREGDVRVQVSPD